MIVRYIFMGAFLLALGLTQPLGVAWAADSTAVQKSARSSTIAPRKLEAARHMTVAKQPQMTFQERMDMNKAQDHARSLEAAAERQKVVAQQMRNLVGEQERYLQARTSSVAQGSSSGRSIMTPPRQTDSPAIYNTTPPAKKSSPFRIFDFSRKNK